MIKGLLALVAVSALLLTTHGDAAAQKAAATPMLSGPLLQGGHEGSGSESASRLRRGGLRRIFVCADARWSPSGGKMVGAAKRLWEFCGNHRSVAHWISGGSYRKFSFRILALRTHISVGWLSVDVRNSFRPRGLVAAIGCTGNRPTVT